MTTTTIATDVLIKFLPCEVLEYILENKNLQIHDVINFALTCKHLYWTVTTSNKLWKTKFLQRWPILQEAFENQGIQNPDWREETRERFLCRQRLMEKLSQMSAKHYGKWELSDVDFREDYDPLFLPEHGARPMSYHYLIDELVTLLGERVMDYDLTHKHYAHKVARYLKQTYLAREWEKYLALPRERQTTELGAHIVAQWSQPEKHILFQSISNKLDDIARQTRDLVTEQYPNIPINSVPSATLARWKVENIYDNQWSNEDSRAIVSSLCEMMFNKLGFHGNSEMYYSSVNSFIDQVLIYRRGIPITLAIVFESVARRLGLHCEAISFPTHFLLRWKERYLPNVKDDEEFESYYIDVFNGGKFLTRNNCSGIAGAARCPIERYNIHQATSAVEVVQRMAGKLEVAGRQRTHLNGRAERLRSALELLHMVKPRDTNTILHLARFYMLHQMDVTGLIGILNDMLNDSNEERASRGQAKLIMEMLEDYGKRIEVTSPTPKMRTPDVKYAVGMIMTDRFCHQCVITGWDTKCERSCESEFQRDGVCGLLNDGNNQPFYHVYVEDGSCRYVPQESLMITGSPSKVNHREIGRHFCKFMGSYYLPNEEKAKEYPEDEEFRNKMHGISHNHMDTAVL